MATIRPMVNPRQQKKDGTWNVKLILTHNVKKAYIETQYFVTIKQLRKDYTIKDQFILNALSPQLYEYRKKIGDLGEKLNFHSAQSLRDLLIQGELRAETINFIEFGWSVVKLIEKKKTQRMLRKL